jgi:tartrate/fumarate subfamily iron-sulfur-dependent hydro-lyase beta chain
MIKGYIMKTYELQAPLSEADVIRLKIGDLVYISGPAFSCRSRLHRYVFDEGHEFPLPPGERNVLLHSGPIMKKSDSGWDVISYMPTSSIRFEKWGPSSVDMWKLRMIVGKTTMGDKTRLMMRERKCVHVSPQCVSPNLWIDSISVEDVKLFDELGSIEATWCLNLSKLGPFVVDIDCEGNKLFEKVNREVDKRREKAMEMLDIPADFEYTKLY